jgi:hypothetical protein
MKKNNFLLEFFFEIFIYEAQLMLLNKITVVLAMNLFDQVDQVPNHSS